LQVFSRGDCVRGKRGLTRRGKQPVNANGEGTLARTYHYGTRDEFPVLQHTRHCERSEAIQTAAAEGFWIASLRSQ
jgi:hypothetical protein